MMNSFKSVTALLGATALSLGGTVAVPQGVDCGADFDAIPAGCEAPNADVVVTIPVAANVEGETQSALQGFVISVDGERVAGDTRTSSPIVNAVRQTDIALADADIQITYDGLGTLPRLDLSLQGDKKRFQAGDVVSVKSALNYPSFVTRGEVRIIDAFAAGGERLIAVVPLRPNGSAQIQVPDGEQIVLVHRVYDAGGRFDETKALRLSKPDARGFVEGVEAGSDNTAQRNIPVTGGAITVRGTSVVDGAKITTLGETLTPSDNGAFVMQRILPAGNYGVNVRIEGPGQNVDLTRDLTIPRVESFQVGTLDLTFGNKVDLITGKSAYYGTGRAAFYVEGRTQGGLRYTTSVDTGEGDIATLFDNIGKRDPRTLLLRVDPSDLYPTYGDDSTIEDRTPTSGKVFFRVEDQGSYAQWGDFDSDLGDNVFVQNSRSLYGASGRIRSQSVNADGQPVAAFYLYAAQPDLIPQRDQFRGTGGATFFLGNQDVAGASETITVQLIDPNTDRVIETRTLTAGEDYQINYIQGIVTLKRPLQASVQSGLFASGATGTANVVLVVQYEARPAVGNVDGYTYGTRAQAWVGNTLRLGVSGMLDQTGVNNHNVVGGDILYQISEETYLRGEFAQSNGSAGGTTFSPNAGLIVQTKAGSGTSGTALKLTGRSSFADFGLPGEGAIGGYFERREAGFSSNSAETTAATGNEQFWGVYADGTITSDAKLRFVFDSYENAKGDRTRSTAVEADYTVNPLLTAQAGIEHQNNKRGGTAENRTDVAARLVYEPEKGRTAYVFAQATLDRSNLKSNNRVGLGADYEFAEDWTISAELSTGDLGEGGRVSVGYTDETGNTRYAGYEIDPGRQLDGISLDGRDRGRVVIGGRQAINEQVTVFGENSYDVFGRHKTLLGSYGINYEPISTLSFSSAIELGQVRNGTDYDLDRQALTFGAIYQTDDANAAGRLEYRRETGVAAGVAVTSDTILLNASAEYRIDDDQRVVVDGEVARSETKQSPLLDGNYADVVLGYALRPIKDDRLNILARYRYLEDMFGLRDVTQADGPRQRTNVVSVDATYDIDRRWTVGGKFGYRSTESAPDGKTAFTSNNALLAVANARYHIVHDWDALLELRVLNLYAAGTTEIGTLGAVYKHVGNNMKVGVGYNFGTFSDDLTDLTFDDRGAFINIVAKF